MSLAEMRTSAEIYDVSWQAMRDVVLAQGHAFSNCKVWGVPRGGVHVALLMESLIGCTVVDSWRDADIIVDDIIDSGSTRDSFKNTGLPFWAPWDKTRTDGIGYVVFPWESEEEEFPESHIRRFIQSMGGMGLSDENIRDTPARVVATFKEMTEGELQDPHDILSRRFVLDGLDEMVVVRAIPFWSLCEHHLLPFSGFATVAYIAEDWAVGLSKIPRLVQCFAKRLQMQERLTQNIAGTLHTELQTAGTACVIRGVHTCMKIRGVQSDGEMVTSSLFGVFKTDPIVRQEFLSIAGV